MPLLKNDKNELINFIHIPKTGGTSIEKNLEANYPISFLQDEKFAIVCTPQHIDYKVSKYLGLDKLTDRSFAVVRHPIDRMVSEYFYRKKINYRVNLYFDINSFILFALQEYKRDDFIFDNHIKPQVEFLYENTRVFKLENGFDLLFEHLRSDFFFSSASNKEHHFKSKKEVFKLNQLILYKLSEHYSEDFERLGYEIPKTNKPSHIDNFYFYFSYSMRKLIYKLDYFFANKLFKLTRI